MVPRPLVVLVLAFSLVFTLIVVFTPHPDHPDVVESINFVASNSERPTAEPELSDSLALPAIVAELDGLPQPTNDKGIEPPPAVAEAEGDDLCQLEENVDFFGGDLLERHAIASPLDCCAACHTNRLCRAFTYLPISKACYLKTKVRERRSSGGRRMISGVRSKSAHSDAFEDLPLAPPPPPPSVELSEKQLVTQKRLDACKSPEQRALAVKHAMQHAWNGYRQYAFGTDELEPLSQRGKQWLGLGATLVDSLDTLWIMGLREEFDHAKSWVALHLSFDVAQPVSMFETTIRILGGLLSAYDLSGDKMFLEKSEDIGKRLLRAWKSAIPDCSVDLVSGVSSNPSWTGGAAILAEVGTVQLEMVYLSVHTGNPIFAQKALSTYHHLAQLPGRRSGLYSIYVDANSFRSERVSLGAMGDSFFEYLLKLPLLLTPPLGRRDANGMQWGDVEGGVGARYLAMYHDAMRPVKEHMFKRSHPNNLFYIAEYDYGHTVEKMDHLACFAGGMLALEAQLLSGEPQQESLVAAKGVAETCFEMYRRQRSGLAPEFVEFNRFSDFAAGSSGLHNIQRPETVETLFVLWRMTRDTIYREWGWLIFSAFELHCRLPAGYSGVRDVSSVPVSNDDTMQSFFLAETLKYLFLLFSDTDVIPLDKYVFNTEAHPLSRLTLEQASFVAKIIKELPPI